MSGTTILSLEVLETTIETTYYTGILWFTYLLVHAVIFITDMGRSEQGAVKYFCGSLW